MSRGGYVPNPALEDSTWHPILCSCGTAIALTDGRLMRYRCIDRRCRRPGTAKLVYFDLSVQPPEEIAHTYVAVKVERVTAREGCHHGK